MAIRFRSVLCAMALVGGSVLITSQVVSQDQKQQQQQMEEMWQQWLEYAKPGPEHELMARGAGTWHQETKHWMYPGAEPEVSHAIAKLKPILGGRFMMEELKGKMKMGEEEMDFEGLGIFGFDNIKQKHIFVWVDNMGTLMMTGEGTADETGKIVTYYSKLPNPMTGGEMEIKSVSTQINDDKAVFEMYEKYPDGSWFRNMEITATRKGEQGKKKY